MKNNAYNTTSSHYGVFVATLKAIALAVAFFVATTTFAQEETPEIQATQASETIETTESLDITTSPELVPSEGLVSELTPEPELTQEQQRALRRLDRQLERGRITQEEYDTAKNELLGITSEEPELEAESLSLRSASLSVEPEAQSLGKYVAPQVSTQNGSLNYAYPIVVPSGRNGLTPNLSLNYNSNNTSPSSIIATGWSFDIPYIQRLNKTGTDNLYTTDTFTSSLDGELIDQGNGIYTPRVETGSFLKYEYTNNTWTITDKTGTIYEFGTTTQAQQNNPDDVTQIYSWMLEKVTDTNGNTIDYTYYKDGGQIYPNTISYVNGLFEVNFERSNRTTPYTAYTPGFEVTTNYYINEVQVQVDNQDTIEYLFDIQGSLLKNVEVTSIETQVDIPEPQWDESWQASGMQLPVDTNGKVIIMDYQTSNYGSSVVDVNGDDLPDVVNWYRGKNNSYAGTSSYPGNEVYLNNGSTWVADSNYLLPTTSNGTVVRVNYTKDLNRGGTFADVNNDGYQDIITWRYRYNNSYADNEVYLGNGSTWVADPSFQLPTDSYGRVTSLTYEGSNTHGSFIADVNGDDLPDVVAWRKGLPNTQGGSSSYLPNEVYINTGTGWVADPTFLLPTDSNNNVITLNYDRHYAYGASVADVNGDDLPDIVSWRKGEHNSHADNEVYINTGTTWQADPSFELPTDSSGDVIRIDYRARQDYGSFLEDVNNDGKADIVSWRRGEDNTHNDNVVYLNTGTGWEKDENFLLPTDANGTIPTLSYTTSRSYGTTLNDVDNDGLLDILQWTKNQDNTHLNNEVYLNVSDTIIPPEPINIPEFDLPPIELSYHSEVGANGFVENTPYSFDHEAANANRAGDLNGDGLLDYISSYKYGNGNYWKVSINTGTGFITSSDWDRPQATMYFKEIAGSNQSKDIQLVDINGDGFSDLVDLRGNPIGNSGNGKAQIYLNNGTSFVLEPSFEFDHKTENMTQFGDLNGDGLTDAITSYNDDSYIGWFVHVNNGTSFDTHEIGVANGQFFSHPTINQDMRWAPAQMNHAFRDYGNGNKTQDIQLVDINGDGLADILDNHQSSGNDAEVFLNTGTGFEQAYVGSTHRVNAIYATKTGDLNGDNLTDIIHSVDGTSTTYLNTGNGFEQSNEWQLPAGMTFRTTGSGYDIYDRSITDINGDSLADIVDMSGSPYTNSNADAKIYLNTGDGISLSNLTNHQGGENSFTYTVAQQQDDSNDAPFPIKVVETITTDDQEGNVGITSYQYRGADFYYNTPHDKKFAGFAEVIQTNPDGSMQTTKYHQGNGEQGNEPTDSYSKIGRVYEQTLEDASGNLYSRTRTNYTESNLGGESNSILTSSQLSQQFDGTTSSTDTASSYTYDNYGNVTEEVMHGEVTGNADGSFSDTGSDTRTSEYTYTNDTTNYIVGLPTNQTLENNSGTKEAERIFAYDSDGNLTTESRWIQGSNYADTSYTYNSKGLVTSETDALGNTTSYAYDPHILYPDEVTNAENHITTYIWDYSSGKPTEVVEANGKVTQYTYDGLDRLLEVKETIENGDPQTIRTISYHTQSTPQYSRETIVRGNTPNQEIYSYLDGFGRTIQVKSEAEDYWVTLDTIYDDMGRVDKQSLPYETTSKSNSSTTSNNDLLTSFSYDTLGRVTLTSNAKGTTTTSYDGFETTITDTENNQKDLVTDAYGNLVQVNEYNGGSVYETEYQYNTQNLLTKITDAENNVRNIDYDGLGRRTSLEDLHASTDSSYGTWTFTYNDLNLTSQTDPKGATTSYTYDDINRVLTENNDSTTGVDTTYSYDNCLHGDGMLCTVTTPEVTTTYTYQKQGLTESETKTIDSVDYTTSYDYNKQGDVTKTTHPNGSVTEYGYNQRGLVNEVKLAGQSLVTAEYGVHGRPTQYVHSNGVTSTFTYDPTELYELTNKTTTNGATDFQDLSYSYDDVGNITQIIDASDTDTAKTQSFSYDDLYRLTGTTVTNASNGQNYLRSYSYSPIGNITSFNGTSFSYSSNGYANPHAVTSVGGQSYSYDNNGNLTSDGTWNHAWNYDNTLASSSNGSTTSSYEYDHTNQRIKLVEGSNITIYPTTSYEVENGTPKIDVNLGDTLVATEEAGTINHVHTDHLGGTNITTDSTGIITQTLDYYPYGDARIDAGTNDETKQFTGYVRDSLTQLHYAGARYHDSSIGRFISQDPVSLFEFERIINDPQKMNMYSYARNNPIMYVDPDGETPLLIIPVVLAAYFLDGVNYAHAPATEADLEQGVTQTDILEKTVLNQVGGDYDSLSPLEQVGVGLTIGSLDGKPDIEDIPRAIKKTIDDVTNLTQRNIDDIARETNWGRSESLIDHTQRHGSDFGLTDPSDYARSAQDFKSRVGQPGVDSFTDSSGVTRVYDSGTNSFGSYNPDGSTRTYFKPENGNNYWTNQRKKYETGNEN